MALVQSQQLTDEKTPRIQRGLLLRSGQSSLVKNDSVGIGFFAAVDKVDNLSVLRYGEKETPLGMVWLT